MSYLDATEQDLKEALVQAVARESGWDMEEDIDNARETVSMVMPTIRNFCVLKSGQPWEEQ